MRAEEEFSSLPRNNRLQTGVGYRKGSLDRSGDIIILHGMKQ